MSPKSPRKGVLTSVNIETRVTSPPLDNRDVIQHRLIEGINRSRLIFSRQPTSSTRDTRDPQAPYQ